MSTRTDRSASARLAMTKSRRRRWVPLGTERLEDRTVPAANQAGAYLGVGDVTGDGVADLGVGAARGGGPRARLFDGRTGDLLSDRFYGPDSARGGASVALSADGVFVGSGGGRAAAVGLYDVRTGNLIREFLPFPGYDGPVNVATGDLDGDGRAELIATPGAGGGPVVAAFDARTGAAVGTFLAGPAGDRGGLSVTSADVDGDGKAEVVVGDLAGRAARVYRAGGALLAALPGIDDPNYAGGVSVGAGDLNGDGKADVVVGAAAGAARVAVWDGAAAAAGQARRLVGDFFAAAGAGGVDVGVTTAGGKARVLVAAGTGDGAGVAAIDHRTGRAGWTLGVFGGLGLPDAALPPAAPVVPTLPPPPPPPDSPPPTGADTTPPSVVQATPAGPFVINRNPTVLAAVADDRAGVAAEVSLDGGAFTPVPVAADGTVSFTPALPLDGSADGPHTVALRGRDAAGNRSAARATAFTLDTRPPALTLALAGGGLTTADGTVSLRGTTEPGLTVRLGDAGPTAVAGPDGVFTFPGVTLALGANPFTAAASDEAGNRGSASATVTRTAPAGSPTVAARLLSDTAPGGGTNADGLTRDPVITGTVTTFDGASVAGLEARVGAGAYADVTGSLTGGAFTLSRVTLAALAGGPLADGPVTVAVRAVDGRGRASAPAVVAFTLDSTAPIVPALVTPAGGTTTTLAVATLSGVAEPGAVLTLDPGNRTATAGATGAFSFPDVPLAVGANAFTLVAADAAGNAASAARTVTRTIESGGGTTPTPELAPASNTGRVPAANRTNLTTPAVRVETAVGDTVEFFVDGNSVGTATAAGNPTTFILPALADGPHAVAAQRTSAGGLGDARSAALTVTVDTAAPAAATLAVPAASQAGGPRTVAAARVTLVGTAEPDAVVALVGSVKTALAGADGTFTLTDVSLALGENVLTLTVTDAAGNATTAAAAPITRVATPVGQADPVLSWVDQTLAAVRADASSPPVASRAMGMAFGAMGDAVAAIEGRTGQFVTRTAPAGTSAAAAVAAAARDVLAYLYPAQVAALDAAQASSLAAVPDGQAKTDGIALGRAVAAAVVAQRDGDGWDRFATYSTAGGQGNWVPTAPAYAEPLLPAWGQVAPFALTSGDQFRPAAPYALTSPEYAADLAEVRSLGRRDSTARTADQTQVARFWADGGGTSTPAGHWVALARQVAAEKGNSLSANARLMAVLGAAMADAAIACWDAKYAYGFWRPDTAIEKDPAAPDAGWAPLITTPPFPEYMSGHATFSGAAAEILADAFGDDVGFTLTSEGLPGVTRTFTSFSQAAAEGGRSRIYGGIHFQLSNAVGQDVGRKVGRRVLDVFNTAADTVAPTTTVTGEVPAATRTNPTVTGRVRDNLSGVATLTVSVDGGPAAPVAFDAAGNFTVTTALALDGTAEGRHTLAFVAADKAGNTFSGPTVAFVLATRAPNLTVTAPAAGAALAAGALLTGSVAGSTAPIARLTYQFAGQPAVPVIVGPAGAFSAAFDLSRLAAGDHSLTVTATDAAGNTASVTRAATLAAAVPFRVSQTAPAAGSSEVGVTFRPQVFFTRPANPATLTPQTITASDAAGNSLPLSIVPADDGTFAWVYFTNPLPGGTRVTLAVDGDLITAPDGAKLDADADGTPGGRSTVSFTTVSTAAVPGTTLTGVLADPGPDNKPFTFDDAGAGPDGSLMTGDDVYKKPIAGVTVYPLGQEDNKVLTDAQGRFTLSNLPAGNVKLVLDGRTATNAPAGFYFPEMVMDLTVKPGVSQTVMGSMGTGDQQRGLAAVTGVHLPRVAVAALETVSNTATAPVTIDLNPASSQGLTPEQASQLTVTLQPGSLLGEDGEKVGSAQVGISTVPPELVRDMLPPGVLQHTFDITIQALGVTALSAPATMTFPNVFDAAPGTKLNFLSFDHTTGRLVIEGTATVSADGKSVVTDPGTGVVRPGWHGLTPPGTDADSPPPKDPDEPLDCDEINDILGDDYARKQGTGAGPLAHQLACLAEAACDPKNVGWGGPGTWVNDTIQHFTRERVNPTWVSSAPNALDLPGLLTNPTYPPIAGMGEQLCNYIPDWIPTPLPTPVPGVFVPIQSGDVCAVLGGVGRHFPYELLPSFWKNADHLHDTAIDPKTGQERLMHDLLFDEIGKCFDKLVQDGEISPFAGWVAKNGVPAAAAVLRETIWNINQALNYLGSLAGDLFGTQDFPTLPDRATRDQLFAPDVAAFGKLRVEAVNGDFFVPVGGAPQLRVLRENSDGTTTDVTAGAVGTKYFAVVGDGTAAVSADGKLSVTGTISPVPNSTPMLYVVVRNGDDFGVGQFAVTDVDTDGDLLVDSYERLIGRSPTTFNALTTDTDRDRVYDIFEALMFSNATSGDSDRDGVGDRDEALAGGNLRLQGDLPEARASSPLYYRVENLGTGFVQRGRTDATGRLPELFLAANTNYRYSLFQVESGRTANVTFRSAASGSPTTIPTAVLAASAAADSDGDGLRDDAEAIVGTDPSKKDTDRDGISDLAALQQGLDPLGGRGLPTGVVGALPVAGQATAVTLSGSVLDSAGQTAYVAAGTGGLAVVNASRFTQPTLVSQLALPGTSTAVAVDDARGLAAVAAGFTGLHVVNVANPAAPALARTVALPYAASAVATYDGLAYVGNGRFVTSVDLLTGETVQALDLAAGDVTGFARDGSTLYAMTSSDTLRVVDLSDFSMTARGRLQVPAAGGKLSVANGVVYVPAGGQAGGYSTVDVSNPDAPALLSGPDGAAGTAYAGTAVVPTGSGLAVAVGSNGFVFGGFTALDLFDASDPSKTAQFVTRINLPAAPADVALGAGIAFVADGPAGLQVVNYVGFDTRGQAPTVSITSPAAGPTVPAGSSVPVRVAAADDVQVRNAELLVNGVVAANQVAAPFGFVATAPAFAPGGANALSIQVRVTDTGGNVTLSNALTYTVVADTAPPALVGTTPAAGQAVFYTPSIDLRFSKPLDASKLMLSDFTLSRTNPDGSAGGVVPIARVDLLSLGRRVAVYPAQALDTGTYTLTANKAALVSRGGVPAAADASVGFSVRTASDIRPLSGTPAVARAPAANVGQAVDLLVGWSPQFTRARFATDSGNPGTTEVAETKSDAARQTATVVVPHYAATGDLLVFAEGGTGFTRLAGWTLARGTATVFGKDASDSTYGDYLPGNGQYAALTGPTGQTAGGRMESVAALTLPAGTYTLSLTLGGSHQGNNGTVTVSLGSAFSEAFPRANNDPFTTVTRTITVPAGGLTARLAFENTGTGLSPLIGGVRLADAGGAVLLADSFDQQQEPAPLQIVPTIAPDSLSVSGSFRNGTLYLTGTGLVPDQTQVNVGGRALTASAYTTGLSVGIPADAPVGPITVTTSGGTSAAYTLAVTGLAATAASGAPADAAVPSANPDQAVTVTGTGLTLNADILVPCVDSGGTAFTRVVRPVAADPAGTSAVFILPTDALTGDVEVVGDQTAGAFRLQVVPVVSDVVLESFDDDDVRLTLVGRGFIDGATTYRVGGNAVADAGGNADVYNSNTRSYLTAPKDGWTGAVRVTTAGGTSAAYTAPGFAVAATAASGTPANPAAPSANPGQTVEITGVGLSTATRLGVEGVYGNDTPHRFTVAPGWVSGDGTRASFDLSDYLGGVATLYLPGAAAGVPLQIVPVVTQSVINNPAYVTLTGRGFVNAAAAYALGGLDLGPSPNISVGAFNVYLSNLPEFEAGGTVVVRTPGGASAPVPVAGLPAAAAPTVGRLEGAAFAGTPADPAAPSANPGEPVVVVGTNLTYTTRVVFPVRYGTGEPDTAEVEVTAVSADRTRATVNVPAYAVSGPVRVKGGTGSAALQVVPTLTGVTRDRSGNYTLSGSGFVDDGTEVTVGGVAVVTAARDDAGAGGRVSGTANGTLAGLRAPFGLDGPIAVRTAGGSAALPAGAAPVPVPYVRLTGLEARADLGTPADGAAPAANPGDTIVLVGQGFTSDTRVRFPAADAGGAVGTTTRAGSVANNGTRLTVVVPANARTGVVTVDGGTGGGLRLQVVPVVRAAGGSFAPGGALTLHAAGLLADPNLAVKVGGVAAAVNRATSRTTYEDALAQELVDVTVPAGAAGQTVEVTTTGGTFLYTLGAGVATLADRAVGLDPGDTFLAARFVDLPADSKLALTGARLETARDVDLYRVRLDAGDRLRVQFNRTDTGLNGAGLRLFDAAGNQLTTALYSSAPLIDRFLIPAAGDYYIGAAGYSNAGYDPAVPNSGTGNDTQTGGYKLTVSRLAAGSTTLTGITAAAGAGTPARAGAAAANTGQTVTLTGSGLTAADRVVFVQDYNSYSDRPYAGTGTVAPAAVAADGTSLTVAVPAWAATGVVRLERETVGTFLQVVPTLSAVDLGQGDRFRTGSFTATGTGFTSGNTAVHFGGGSLGYVTSYDAAAYGRVPAAAAAGPVVVTTPGGTSAPLPQTFTGIATAAATGTPADPAKASANPGQAITLTGSRLTLSTNVVFWVENAYGRRYERVVYPLAVGADGATAIVEVPDDAVTGDLRVVGDALNAAVRLQVVPVVTDAWFTGTTTGGAYAQLRGAGFTETDLAFTFGGVRVDDDDTNTVGSTNTVGYTRLPTGGNWRGAVTATTAGGTSAPFAVGGAAVAAVAFSGTPADPAKPSANAGQEVVVTGSRLTRDDALYLTAAYGSDDEYEAVLRPDWVSADGTRAGYDLPRWAGGVARLGLLGSAADLAVQVVPVVTQVTGSPGSNLRADGFGFADDPANRYAVGGVTVAPSPNIAVYSGSVYLNNLPAYNPAGTLTVRTVGGTSAPVPAAGVPAAAAATVTGLEGAAFAGTPADPARPSANAGETVVVVGTNLTANSRVVFPRRYYSTPDTEEVAVSAVSADGTRAEVRVPDYAATGDVTVRGGTGAARLQVVPTITGVSRDPGGRLTVSGSGFETYYTRVAAAGQVVNTGDPEADPNGAGVSGGQTGSVTVYTDLGPLDGPITVTTAGGSATWADPGFAAPAFVELGGIVAALGAGAPADGAVPFANPGQTITLTGRNLTTETVVRFPARGLDGTPGTVSVRGTPNSSRTALTVLVPPLAVTGNVAVVGGAPAGVRLQILPRITAATAAGGLLVLEGYGLPRPGDPDVLVDGVPAAPVAPVVPGSGPRMHAAYALPVGATGAEVVVRTAGGAFTFRGGVALPAVADAAGAAGGTLAAALAVDLPADTPVRVPAASLATPAEVDLYKVRLAAGDRLRAEVQRTDTQLTGASLRVFDAAGGQVAAALYSSQPLLSWWEVPAAGDYYVGVSGYYNVSYNPVDGSGGSGTSSTAGGYRLLLTRLGGGTTTLTGITAAAGSGTPARAALPSANPGQTITLTGVGLTTADRVVFTQDDYYGDPRSSQVTPASVAADGTSLTVAVPTWAVTGEVRLARESAGRFLQVVPVVTGLGTSNGDLGDLYFSATGSGLDDGARRAGLAVGGRAAHGVGGSTSNTYGYTPSDQVPPTGPVTVTTAGGTSAAAPVSFTGLTGTAATGTPPDPAKPSANVGQKVTVTGVGLSTDDSLIYKARRTDGTLAWRVWHLEAITGGGTAAQWTVPTDAVTGEVYLFGDRLGTVVTLQIV